MMPGDYFAINTPPEVFAKLGIPTVNLALLCASRGRKKLTGRTGAGFHLAVGHGAKSSMRLPGMDKLLGRTVSNVAILFEAMFILTTVDAGTRVARHVLHRVVGKVY